MRKPLPFAFEAKASDALKNMAPTLAALTDELQSLPEFTAATIEAVCKNIATKLADGKLGKVAMPLRAALTGTVVSPSIFHAAEILAGTRCWPVWRTPRNMPRDAAQDRPANNRQPRNGRSTSRACALSRSALHLVFVRMPITSADHALALFRRTGFCHLLSDQRFVHAASIWCKPIR